MSAAWACRILIKKVASRNPRLIYCSITGFGQSGPMSPLPGYDPIFQAMSGLLSITGLPDGSPGAGPALVGYSISDITAGQYAVVAIPAALNYRDAVSGEGQFIDIALLDTALHAVDDTTAQAKYFRKKSIVSPSARSASGLL